MQEKRGTGDAWWADDRRDGLCDAHGTLDGIENTMHLMHGSKDNVTMGTSAFGAITMDNMIAIAKFDLSAYDAAKDPVCTAISTATLDLKISAFTPGAAGNITLNNVSANYYMALIPSATSQDLMFSQDGSGDETLSRVITAGKLYTQGGSAITVAVEPVETDEWINFNDPDMEVTGLPIWAKYNLGVDKSNLDHAYDWYGDYYAWGEVEPYYTDGHAYDNPCSNWKDGKTSGYDWPSFKWCNGSYNTLTKYNNSSSYGTVDNKTTLELADDAARAVLGGTWRMPTGGSIDGSGAGEWQQLYNSTLWVWTGRYNDIDGLAGYVVYKVKATAHK